MQKAGCRRNNKIREGWCALLFQITNYTMSILCLLEFLFLPTIALAEQKPDAGQPGYFMRLATDARVLGMGGAGVACPDAGIFYNPAGIAVPSPLRRGKESRQIQLMTVALPFPDTSYNFLSYTRPAGKRWGIGLGVPVLKVTGAEKRTGEYESSGTFDDQHLALGLGIARSFSSGISVGLTLKAMQQRFYETTTSSGDIDAGLLYQPSACILLPTAYSLQPTAFLPVLSLGVSIQNILGSTVKQVSGEVKMPRIIRAGVSYRPIDRASLAVDMEKTSGRSLKLCLGGEYSPLNFTSIRAGYDDQGYLTCGFGLKLQKFTLDYGLQNHSCKMSHRVSVGVEF